MSIPIYQVDAFTKEPFKGNPAGVCPLTSEPSAKWMQNLALEMNLAETAFIWPIADGFGLRWFTPIVEVDLCGHATLASAHVLWESGRLDPQTPARFFTKSGWLTCTKKDSLIEMDFPAEPASPVAVESELILALGKYPIWIGRNRMDYLVEVPSEETLREMEPDLQALAKIESRGIIVTAESHIPNIDFVSRFFAPQSGVPEDPVTGSAHCCLAPYWREKLGKTEMVGYQASKRGGFVRVRCIEDRVILGGNAVTVFEGKLTPQSVEN